MDIREVPSQAEAALRESELRYRSVLGLMPAAVYTCEAPAGVITFYNEHAAALWGRTPRPGDSDERFCGSFRLWHPDGRPMPHAETPMALAMREGRKTRNQEVVIERPDGSRITALVNIDPLRDTEGRVTGAINVFHDVTERRRAEQALRASEERYRAVVESQAEMVCRFRPDGTILFVNGAYARARGTTPEALRERNFWDFVAEQDRSAVRAMLERLTPEAPEIRIENRFATAEGERWTLWTNRALAFDAEGRLLEAQSTGIDITDRKRAEADNARLYEESRRLVAELREADRRKDEFMAMLAHELRNPLSTINLGTDLLKLAKPGDEKARFAVPAIERQARQLQRLVDDMLDMARATYGKLTLQKQPVDLFETAQAVAAMQADKGESVRLEVLGGPAWVNGDPVRVQQMIGNLLENAVKYGGRNIGVRVSRQDDWCRLSVEDDGQGITPDLLRDLFKPFVQGEQLLDRAQGGLGLGLALVHRLAAMHGGSVDAYSQGPGQGSRFTLSLPAGKARGAQGPAPTVAAVGKRRVLVIEDEADVRDMLRLLLESDGHEVSVAANGADGLALLGALRPEVALVDIGLPGMDGYELARRARLLPGGAGLRLIAVTGYGQEKDRRKASAAGFDLHLTKPVMYEDLVHAFAR